MFFAVGIEALSIRNAKVVSSILALGNLSKGDSVLIYIHPKCSTCKDALRILEAKGIACTVKDITQTPPTMAELERMLSYKNGDVKKLFNSSGQLYREMELSTKLPHMSLQAALTLLTQHGMLVKRPFLLGKDFGLTGFNTASWAKVF